MNYKIIFLSIAISLHIFSMQPIRHNKKIVGYAEHILTQQSYPPRIFYTLYDAEKNNLGTLYEVPFRMTRECEIIGTPDATFDFAEGQCHAARYLIGIWRPELLENTDFRLKD